MISRPLKTPVTLVIVGSDMVKDLATKIKNGLLDHILTFPPRHPAKFNDILDFKSKIRLTVDCNNYVHIYVSFNDQFQHQISLM